MSVFDASRTYGEDAKDETAEKKRYHSCQFVGKSLKNGPRIRTNTVVVPVTRMNTNNWDDFQPPIREKGSM
ncbi:MAG: hypothetical protein A2X67_04010 [Ignavibacteria bacterium GWA2_55_11]|nr:MAG: hypothetical protein A2X67_04010 [Ignavibacteria bacterium GWA2_55_11]OGU44983.1 MAG: hypothetical protein A2X68_11185 [Ignavibacteria bacterium GWC2_56_12]OGU65376.1 MAG: hypothetical protein A3C56_11605 [Ignavibacteria bacterium RIFCSPHIGHO2_02_FULL_56_12]OGU75454.1 MAG: hypothetical protein A3H45_08995 [Ignavibacteria bacterium RIFCSPLOWO2_02_FULL_55_14]HAV22552.1 hypothetical protein [Bacteroidota bacterium]